MAFTKQETARLIELRGKLAAYRHMTIEEAEASDAGDHQIEMEHEVWLLEQERYNRPSALRVA